MLLVLLMFIFLINIIRLLILEFVVITVLITGTTRLRAGIIVLIRFTIKLGIHLV